MPSVIKLICNSVYKKFFVGTRFIIKFLFGKRVENSLENITSYATFLIWNTGFSPFLHLPQFFIKET